MVNLGLAESRARATALVLAGSVAVNGQAATKPGKPVSEADTVEVKKAARFVSRGGEKLLAALERWPVDLAGRVCLDVGASTGGFTDCLLQHGAALVYAVDSGTNQIDARLRSDARVVVREQTNARYLEAALFDPRPDFAVADVSFISLRVIAAAVARVLTGEALWYALVKPQFEAGPALVGKGGVVDPAHHRSVVGEVLRDLGTQGWTCEGLMVSPVPGLKKGNVEYLARLRWQSHASTPEATAWDEGVFPPAAPVD